MQRGQVGRGGQLGRGVVAAEARGAGVAREPRGGRRGGVPRVRGHRAQLVVSRVSRVQGLGEERSDGSC